MLDEATEKLREEQAYAYSNSLGKFSDELKKKELFDNPNKLERLLCIVNLRYPSCPNEIKRRLGKLKKAGYPVEKDYWKMKRKEVDKYLIKITNHIRKDWKNYNSLQLSLF